MSRILPHKLDGISILGIADTKPIPEDNLLKELRESDDYYELVIAPAIDIRWQVDQMLVSRLEFLEVCRAEYLLDPNNTAAQDRLNEAEEIVDIYRTAIAAGQLALAA